MNRMKNCRMVVTLFLAEALLLAHPAFARDPDLSFSVLRQENRPAIIRVEGQLACPTDNANAGDTCELTLMDKTSGRSFRLIEAGDAFRLYGAGTRNVKVEGTYSNGGSAIAVSKVSAL
jgi:hypothetical protein